MTTNAVDPAALASFQQDGFIAFPDFLNGPALAELIDHVERLISDIAPGLPPEMVFYDDKSDPTSLKQIQHLADHDPYFHDLFVASPFRDVAEGLVGGPVEPKNMQYFNKPPRTSKPTPPHQDGFYFMLDPCSAVTMWFALDDADHQNGCVRYISGSHRQGMRDHRRTRTLGFSQGIADFPTSEDREQEVAMPARSGDLLVHHAMTIHRAEANASANRSRRSLGFIYYDRRAKQDEFAHAKYQHKLVAEMTEQGRI